MSENPFAPPPHWQEPSFINAITKWEGGRALFVERPEATVVRVTNIRLDEWGVNLDITDEKLPGFGRLPTEDGICSIGGAWGALSASGEWWHAQYSSWSLYFNAERLDSLIDLARQEVEQRELIPYVIAGRWMRSSAADLAGVGWPVRR